MDHDFKSRMFIGILLAAALACNAPSGPGTNAPAGATSAPAQNAAPQPGAPAAQPPGAAATSAPQVAHVMTPSTSPQIGKLIYDVDSSVTAAEKRAPYGDSYDINRLERPFLQDMTYVPDLDITTFALSNDKDWYYVSAALVGNNPNNKLGIDYAVELDTNADGFGDYVIWATPTYSTDWTTTNVKVYQDTNHNSSGLSAEKSDAPSYTDGYDKLIFDGAKGVGDDPDLAWIRMGAGPDASVQFAFKQSLAGNSFMFGVIADAGLKDVSKLDYVDRFKESDAGSPVKDKKYYPLGKLFAVDNTCRGFFGFKPTGYEPMLCPSTQPVPTGRPTPVPTP